MMSQTRIQTAPPTIAPWWGDPHPLLEQIGAPADLAAPPAAGALISARITSLPALRAFLHAYQTGLLVPLELPAILGAFGHAVRHEARELVALDRQLAGEPRLREFAVASCRVGQRQLHRLRPLRDHRLVQRYLAAVDRGDAHGWHTLVYGITLGVFALPPRQGLLSYAEHTLRGFIENAARPLTLSAGQCRDLHGQACAALPEAVQRLLLPQGRLVLGVI